MNPKASYWTTPEDNDEAERQRRWQEILDALDTFRAMEASDLFGRRVKLTMELR